MRADTLFRKVKHAWSGHLGQDVHVLVGCYSDWNDDVKYVAMVSYNGEEFGKWESWSPRAALKEALRGLPKANGGSSQPSPEKSDSATSDSFAVKWDAARASKKDLRCPWQCKYCGDKPTRREFLKGKW